MDQPDVPFQEAHLVIPESLFDWLSWTVLRLWLRLWCCYCCWFTVKNPGDSQLSEMNEQSVRLPLRTSSLTVPHPNFPSSPMPRCAYHALALAPSTAKVKLCVCSLCSIFRTGVHFTPTITRRSYKHNRKLIRPWERERERDRERERERATVAMQTFPIRSRFVFSSGSHTVCSVRVLQTPTDWNKQNIFLRNWSVSIKYTWLCLEISRCSLHKLLDVHEIFRQRV